jgi:uncharacterized membrane protein YdbT with pleckstrin-like domain
VELMAGETVVWRGRPSWRAMMSFYARGIVIALVPLAAGLVADRVHPGGSFAGWAALVTAVIIAWVLLAGWIRRVSTVYLITDRRIQIRHGLLARQTREALLDRVQNITTRQTTLDRVFRVGTLDFDTAGTDDSDFKFVGVPNPDALTQRISSEVHARGGSHQGGIAAAS